MISRLVKMTFRSDAIEEFKKIFDESKDLIRNFEGCEHVELLQDIKDPRVFFTFSKWRSEENLNAYRHSQLFDTTWARTKVLFDGKPEAWSTQSIAEGIVKG